jgi:hypothetical protein
VYFPHVYMVCPFKAVNVFMHGACIPVHLMLRCVPLDINMQCIHVFVPFFEQIFVPF